MSLHSLVAKVLFLGSVPLTGTLSAVNTRLGTENLMNTFQFDINNRGYSTYSLATSTHELVVGKNTIIAYGVLGGLVLLSCVVTLLFTLRSTAGMVRTPTLTPYSDADAQKYLDLGNILDSWSSNRVITENQELIEGHVTLRK
jgi:hypothetical protein